MFREQKWPYVCILGPPNPWNSPKHPKFWVNTAQKPLVQMTWNQCQIISFLKNYNWPNVGENVVGWSPLIAMVELTEKSLVPCQRWNNSSFGIKTRIGHNWKNEYYYGADMTSRGSFWSSDFRFFWDSTNLWFAFNEFAIFGIRFICTSLFLFIFVFVWAVFT